METADAENGNKKVLDISDVASTCSSSCSSSTRNSQQSQGRNRFRPKPFPELSTRIWQTEEGAFTALENKSRSRRNSFDSITNEVLLESRNKERNISRTTSHDSINIKDRTLRGIRSTQFDESVQPHGILRKPHLHLTNRTKHTVRWVDESPSIKRVTDSTKASNLAFSSNYKEPQQFFEDDTNLSVVSTIAEDGYMSDRFSSDNDHSAVIEELECTFSRTLSSVNDYFLMFLNNAFNWLDKIQEQLSKKKFDKYMNDYLNASTWGDLLNGIRNHRYQNCFLGGDGEKVGIIDSQMAQFAEIKIVQLSNGKRFLTWLDFGREVIFQENSYILHARGPLIHFQDDFDEKPKVLNEKYSIGFLHSFVNLFSRSPKIPRPEDYVSFYLNRVQRMKKNLGELHHDGAIKVPDIIYQELNSHQYRMLIRAEIDWRDRIAYPTVTMLRFTRKGLVEETCGDEKFIKDVSAGISTKEGANLGVKYRHSFSSWKEKNRWNKPVPVLNRIFRSPSVQNKFNMIAYPGISILEFSMSHVIAALNTDIESVGLSLHGMCLCPISKCTSSFPNAHSKSSERQDVLYLDGPLNLSVLCAGGWKVRKTGIFDPNRTENLVNEDLKLVDPLTFQIESRLNSTLIPICLLHGDIESYLRSCLNFRYPTNCFTTNNFPGKLVK